HHPALATAYHHFVGHLLYGTTLTDRQRELVILRVAAARGADYEWGQHVVLGQEAGLTKEEIGAIKRGEASSFSALDAAILMAVDELVADAAITEATWTALAEHLDEKQLLDLIFTVGGYETLAMAMRSCEMPLDDDLRAWLAANGA